MLIIHANTNTSSILAECICALYVDVALLLRIRHCYGKYNVSDDISPVDGKEYIFLTE